VLKLETLILDPHGEPGKGRIATAQIPGQQRRPVAQGAPWVRQGKKPGQTPYFPYGVGDGEGAGLRRPPFKGLSPVG